MLRSLKGYIRLMAKRHKWRSVLLSVEDIVQEATIVLWKVLVLYKDKDEEELVKIFMASFRRHLWHIYRKESIKNEQKCQSLHNFVGNKFEADPASYSEQSGELLVRLRNGGKEVSLLPWDFYKHKLRELARKIGRNNLRDFIYKGRKMNTAYFEQRKEEVLVG